MNATDPGLAPEPELRPGLGGCTKNKGSRWTTGGGRRRVRVVGGLRISPSMVVMVISIVVGVLGVVLGVVGVGSSMSSSKGEIQTKV